ncbi:MAG: hypothetical protein IKE14_00900 [Loktanella sp.]|nr:hypothetical protein [Loktanella sp.]
MSRAIAARIERLEAAKRITKKVRGIIGGLPEPYVEEIGGVLYLRRPETPTREAFVPWAERQQATLQAQLRELFANKEDPQPDARAFVGTVKDQIAPWPEERKRPKFVEVAGKEIEIATFVGFAR